jgi:uncharacterized membrane protein
MKAPRVLRHLVTSQLSVRRAFRAETLETIERTIREAEATHQGEIVFVIEGALDMRSLLRGQAARERALEWFARLRVWDTEKNNGVLIYVLLADRRVEVLADRGIHLRAGALAWKSTCAEMETAFRRGEYREGAVGGIHSVARHLARHFGSTGRRSNELPDEPIIR